MEWGAQSNSAAGAMRRKRLAGLAPLAAASLLALGPRPALAQPEAGPTAAGALEADKALARAMATNDGDAITRLLDPSWAVIATSGGMAEGSSVFPSGIKSGVLTRTEFDISEPRVRVYGDVAVVTTKVTLSGVFNGKPFDKIRERQTDVWVWKVGGWICVLTHETKMAS